MALGLAIPIIVYREGRRLPPSPELGPLAEATLIFDAADRPVFTAHREYRVSVPLHEVSRHVASAVIAAEDRRYFDHRGIDVRRIAGALLANYRAGRIVQGGSTITQQLVRTMYLTRARSYHRKLQEAILAWRLEGRYSKQEILEAYLNAVYLGDGYYGVETAARGYFGEPARELGPGEAATLAAIIPAPETYRLRDDPVRVRTRRDLVLRTMFEAGDLTEEEFRREIGFPVTLAIAGAERRDDPRDTRVGLYFRQAVVSALVAELGEERVTTGGLRIYTTLDVSLQAMAEDAIARRLAALDKGDAGAPLQAAMIAIEPSTGHVRALVGGRDFVESHFDRALVARRQPGSAFKPLLYAAALEAGYRPDYMLRGLDTPIETAGRPWLPGGAHEQTCTTLREALVTSSNRAAAHLLGRVGFGLTINLARRAGISSPLPEVPSLALGTGEVTLAELVSVYAMFSNMGVWVRPVFIRRVEDARGAVLFEAPTEQVRVMRHHTAMLMTSMLADVVQRGTGRAVRRAGFTGPAAGKTGTTDDYADAWFLGFTPTLTAGVWFGYDHPRTIRRSGYAATIAAPAWADFMREATKGARAPWSYQFFDDVGPDRQGLPPCGTAPPAQVGDPSARSSGPTHESVPR
jgi:penicillin-binding protein 1A